MRHTILLLGLFVLLGYYGSFAQNCFPVVSTCSLPQTPAADRRTNKGRLTVATFNAEWLFWDNGKGGPSTKCPADHSAGTCPWKNAQEATEHLQASADIIRGLNVDILALQEVQDCTVLQCLINAIGDPTYRPYLIPGSDSSTNQNVGLISRVDPISAVYRTSARATRSPSESTCGATGPTVDSGVSKHLISNFNIPGIGELALITFHFLSQPDNPTNCIKRECQALVVRGVIDQEHSKGRHVIALGDMNDYDSDVLDKNNNKPISKVSDIIKTSKAGTKDLFNVASIPTQPNRYSDWWDKNDNCVITSNELSLIDQFMVSNTLKSKITSVEMVNTYDFSCGTWQSDHFPIKVTFQSSGEASNYTAV